MSSKAFRVSFDSGFPCKNLCAFTEKISTFLDRTSRAAARSPFCDVRPGPTSDCEASLWGRNVEQDLQI